MTTPLSIAQDIARRGFFPTPVCGKTPILEAWQRTKLDPEQEPEKFRGRFTGSGVVLGLSGLMDLEGDCAAADALLETLAPQTGLVYRSPTGRAHRLYRAQGPALNLQLSREKGGTVAELRGGGEQSVWPGSPHPDYPGRRYQFERDGEPAAVPYPELAAVVRLAAVAGALAAYWPPRGTRHEFALAAAGFLRRAEVSRAHALVVVRCAANAAADEEVRDRITAVETTYARGEQDTYTGLTRLGELGGQEFRRALERFMPLPPGRTWGEAEQAAASAGLGSSDSSGGSGSSRPEWEPPIPLQAAVWLPRFPVDVFPDWLREFVSGQAQALQVPPDLVGMLTLSALAAACGGKFRVRIRPGWEEPTNLYTVTVLPPAERKSAVVAAVAAPLEEWEQTETRRMRSEIAGAEARYRIAEHRLKTAQTEAAKATGADRAKAEARVEELAQEFAGMTVPAQPRLLADDTSPERLATLLRDQQGRMAVLSPEGGIFDLMAGRYGKGGAPNFDVYLKAHPGDTLRVDRVGRPAEYIARPALTLGLALQPEILRGLAEQPGFRGRGLLGRFLYSLPTSALGQRSFRTAPADASEYRAGMLRLLYLPRPKDEAGEPSAYLLHLTPEAREAVLRFGEWLEPQLAEGAALGTLSDWAGKLAGAAVRIAALLHLGKHADHPTPWEHPIDEEAVKAAVRLAHYLIPHAKAAFGQMGADPAVADARACLKAIQRQRVTDFNRRDLFRWVHSQRFPTPDDLDAPLRRLEAHGYVRSRTPAPKGVGRPASPHFDVNPLLPELTEPTEPQAAESSDSSGSSGREEPAESGTRDQGSTAATERRCWQCKQPSGQMMQCSECTAKARARSEDEPFQTAFGKL